MPLFRRGGRGAHPAWLPALFGVGLCSSPAAAVPFDADAVSGLPFDGGASAAGPPSLSGEGGGGAGALAPSSRGAAVGDSFPAVRLGNLGFVSDLPPTAPTGGEARAYTITPSLGVQLLATDNVYQVSSPRRADFITQINPGLTATVDTARLRGSLIYSPTAQFYASTSNQNRFDQQGVGEVLAVIVPGRLFLDVRGATALQSARGGFRPEGTAVVDRRDQVQTSSFQVSPYFVQRFGGWANLSVGYSFQYTNQDGDATSLTGFGQPYFTSQSFTAHEGQAILSSGENFDRFGFVAQATATTYSGTGVLSDAHRAETSVEGRYAFLRGVAGTVEVGYEDQQYGGTPRVRISGPIWSVGVRLTPSPESLIVAKYGRRNGFESAFLDSGFQVGPRTQVSARYTDQLATAAQEQADLLASSRVDVARGGLISRATGSPALYGDSLLAVQGGLFRTQRLTASVTHVWPRDTVTLSVFYQRRRVSAVTAGTQPFAQSGVSGAVTWTHALAPETQLLASVQYGTYTSPQFGSQDSGTFTTALVHQLSETLTGSLQYVLTNQGAVLSSTRDPRFGAGSVQNVIIAGLRKSF